MIIATCHCGAVRLEIAHEPRVLTDCNCSICRRYGALWAYYTHETVRVIGKTAAYVWGDRIIEFHHCPGCGCVTHHERVQKQPDSTVGVNTRMMDPEVIAGVRIRRLDGADTWEYLD